MESLVLLSALLRDRQNFELSHWNKSSYLCLVLHLALLESFLEIR